MNINFIRLEVFRATGEFEERQEIGAGQITSQTGSNRLAANSTRDLDPVLFTFNATIKSGRTIRVTVGLTDDLGNNLDFTADFIFNLRSFERPGRRRATRAPAGFCAPESTDFAPISSARDFGNNL